MKEASLNALFANLLATSFIALGSVLVSAASYHPEYRIQILWGGYAVFSCGLVLLFLYTIFSIFRR